MILQIDALYLLLLAEFSLILLIIAVSLFSRYRKYRQMYLKVQKELENTKKAWNETPPVPRVQTDAVRERGSETAEESPSEEQAPGPPEDAMAGAAGMEIRQAVQEAEWNEGDVPADSIGRLRRMVMYQRNMIIDLMCFKDMFESMQKKMASLKQVNEDLQEKIRSLIAAGMEVPGSGTLESALENSNIDLEKYIGILDKENVRLVGKFRDWEEELKRISDDIGDGPGVDEGRYMELVKEREELAAKVDALEERLREQTKQIDDIQKQHEELEKEYMILYRQQQQQQGSAG